MSSAVVLWRIALAACVIAFVGVVINAHFPFSGVKILNTDFSAGIGIVSHLYPVARMRDMAYANGRAYRSMIEDPVYFDVKTVVPYRTARIELVYDNRTAIPLKVGMKLPKDADARFELKPLNFQEVQGVWTRGEVSFDLSDASTYNSNYTFVLSLPGLLTEKSDTGELRLSHMTLLLEREPLLWSDFITRVKK